MLLNALLIAIKEIRRNILRSILTILGIVIGVASVIAMVMIGDGTTAKVSRDRFMDEISPLYANYNFHKHKGYGTKAHIEAIRKFGRSDIHRFSFKLKALGETESLLQKTLF